MLTGAFCGVLETGQSDKVVQTNFYLQVTSVCTALGELFPSVGAWLVYTCPALISLLDSKLGYRPTFLQVTLQQLSPSVYFLKLRSEQPENQTVVCQLWSGYEEGKSWWTSKTCCPLQMLTLHRLWKVDGIPPGPVTQGLRFNRPSDIVL